MPKMILLDSRIKKYAYREVSEIYRDLEVPRMAYPENKSRR